MNKTKQIYDIVKTDIANGADIYEYIPTIYVLLKLEEYEAAEGIRLAIAELGLEFTIPKNVDELKDCWRFIRKQKDQQGVDYCVVCARWMQKENMASDGCMCNKCKEDWFIKNK